MKVEVTPEPIKNPVARFLILGPATGFGLGLLPKAPGTWGSLLGIPVGLFYLSMPAWMAVLLSFILLWPFSLICDRAARHFGNMDAQKIVLDEVLGMAMTLLGLRHVVFINGGSLASVPWPYFVIGFALFRVLDIFKPFPAKTFDRHATGFGIMADDVVAGIYGALILHGITRIWLS